MIHKAQQDIPFEDAKRISSVVKYLSEVHGFSSIQPWFEVNLDTLMSYSKEVNDYYRQHEIASQVLSMLGVRYVGEWELNDSTRGTLTYSFSVEYPAVLETKQYRYIICNVILNSDADTQDVYIGKKQWSVIFQPDSSLIVFVPNNNPLSEFSVDLRAFGSRLSKEYAKDEYRNNPVPQDSMTINAVHNKNV